MGHLHSRDASQHCLVAGGGLREEGISLRWMPWRSFEVAAMDNTGRKSDMDGNGCASSPLPPPDWVVNSRRSFEFSKNFFEGIGASGGGGANQPRGVRKSLSFQSASLPCSPYRSGSGGSYGRGGGVKDAEPTRDNTAFLDDCIKRVRIMTGECIRASTSGPAGIIKNGKGDDDLSAENERLRLRIRELEDRLGEDQRVNDGNEGDVDGVWPKGRCKDRMEHLEACMERLKTSVGELTRTCEAYLNGKEGAGEQLMAPISGPRISNGSGGNASACTRHMTAVSQAIEYVDTCTERVVASTRRALGASRAVVEKGEGRALLPGPPPKAPKRSKAVVVAAADGGGGGGTKAEHMR